MVAVLVCLCKDMHPIFYARHKARWRAPFVLSWHLYQVFQAMHSLEVLRGQRVRRLEYPRVPLPRDAQLGSPPLFLRQVGHMCHEGLPFTTNGSLGILPLLEFLKHSDGFSYMLQQRQSWSCRRMGTKDHARILLVFVGSIFNHVGLPSDDSSFLLCMVLTKLVHAFFIFHLVFCFHRHFFSIFLGRRRAGIQRLVQEHEILVHFLCCFYRWTSGGFWIGSLGLGRIRLLLLRRLLLAAPFFGRIVCSGRDLSPLDHPFLHLFLVLRHASSHVPGVERKEGVRCRFLPRCDRLPFSSRRFRACLSLVHVEPKHLVHVVGWILEFLVSRAKQRST
mmetsp:Transcript_4070/g.25557  ORF Transcript_4070/g.25557 Transcript_4070/m.25557 type:complete len:334 (+) Transcript_4070:567-1568(+)